MNGAARASRLLRSALPGALGREPGFFLEVTHDCEGVTHWRFGSGREKLIDDRPMLEWLRRRMPVFWMAEGMLSGKRDDHGSAQSPDETGSGGRGQPGITGSCWKARRSM